MYASVEDVQSEFKNLVFTDSTFVTPDTVKQWLIEAGAVINSYVGKKYQTPITGDANSLALMRTFARTMVRDRVRAVMEVKQSGSNTSTNQSARGSEYSTRDVMAALRQIQTSQLSLSGAHALDSGHGFFSSNVANNVKPHFKKGVRQW